MTPFFDIDAINALVNHPSLREITLMRQSANIDVTDWIKSGKAVFLGSGIGGFLFYKETDALWSVHTQFLPQARGPFVAIAATRAAKWMFCNTDALTLTTFVEHGNRAAKALALAVGFEEVAEAEYYGRAGTVLTLSIKQWVTQCL